MKTTLITGGTGFIGQALAASLIKEGERVYVLTRNPGQSHLLQDPLLHYFTDLDDYPSLEVDVVVNLAGAPLSAERWTEAYKKKLIDSRVQTTNCLLQWLQRHQIRPEVFISGSAIGWYGDSEETPLDESSEAHRDFNHKLCNDWEMAAASAEQMGLRVVYLRTGIVLDKGGALDQMLPAFRLGLGGAMGSGNQYWSWIHRLDLVRMIRFIMEDRTIHGPVNGTAPEPLQQKAFAKTLGSVLHRPAIVPMPHWLAHLLLGEFADEVLLKGQRVLPKKMLAKGFVFRYPTLDMALKKILNEMSH